MCENDPLCWFWHFCGCAEAAGDVHGAGPRAVFGAFSGTVPLDECEVLAMQEDLQTAAAAAAGTARGNAAPGHAGTARQKGRHAHCEQQQQQQEQQQQQRR